MINKKFNIKAARALLNRWNKEKANCVEWKSIGIGTSVDHYDILKENIEELKKIIEK